MYFVVNWRVIKGTLCCTIRYFLSEKHANKMAIFYVLRILQSILERIGITVSSRLSQ